jgi:hypothetical protein
MQTTVELALELPSRTVLGKPVIEPAIALERSLLLH